MKKPNINMGSVENLAAVFDEDYDRGYYIPTRMERNVFLKMLIPETPAMIEYKGRDSEEHRETRFLKEELGIKKEKDRILGHLILKRNMPSQ